MPDQFAPSEFGGKATKNLVQPPVTPTGATGHEPTAGEKLGLFYRTGREDTEGVQDPVHFHGLLTLIEQTKKMKNAGLLDKGVEF